MSFYYINIVKQKEEANPTQKKRKKKDVNKKFSKVLKISNHKF